MAHPSRSLRWQTHQNSPSHVSAVTSVCRKHTVEKLEEPNRSGPVWADCQHQVESWGCSKFLPLQHLCWPPANALAERRLCCLFHTQVHCTWLWKKASRSGYTLLSLQSTIKFSSRKALPTILDSVTIPAVFLHHRAVLTPTFTLVSSSVFYVSKPSIIVIADAD